MNNILFTIADLTRQRVEMYKKYVSLEEVKTISQNMPIDSVKKFEEALGGDNISFICEIKKASPSKGVIAENFDYMQIAEDYQNAGADAISCLTEPKWFQGNDAYLRSVASKVNIPVLRKDFVVDEYMIYQAKILGAKAILLICSLLDKDTLKKYIEITDSLGMSALVEAHDEYEIDMALNAGARIIGVNNRNLKDFSVDINNSGKLRKLVPPKVLFVAESGIKTAQDVQNLEKLGVNAVLIGETLMRAENKAEVLNKLKNYES